MSKGQVEKCLTNEAYTSITFQRVLIKAEIRTLSIIESL